MADHNKEHHDCGCHQAVSSVHQTLDEMEFERGLWSAALSGQVDDVEKRLQKGDNVNVKDNSGYSALHYSARNGHLLVCRLLLSSGADVNAGTNAGDATPLHRAAYMGHVDVVQLLLQHGANPLSVDADGMTPLHKAAAQGHKETARILLNAAPKTAAMRDIKDRCPAEMTSNAELKELLSRS